MKHPKYNRLSYFLFFNYKQSKSAKFLSIRDLGCYWSHILRVLWNPASFVDLMKSWTIWNFVVNSVWIAFAMSTAAVHETTADNDSPTINGSLSSTHSPYPAFCFFFFFVAVIISWLYFLSFISSHLVSRTSCICLHSLFKKHLKLWNMLYVQEKYTNTSVQSNK